MEQLCVNTGDSNNACFSVGVHFKPTQKGNLLTHTHTHLTMRKLRICLTVTCLTSYCAQAAAARNALCSHGLTRGVCWTSHKSCPLRCSFSPTAKSFGVSAQVRSGSLGWFGAACNFLGGFQRAWKGLRGCWGKHTLC